MGKEGFKLSLVFAYKGVGFTTSRNLTAWDEEATVDMLLVMRGEIEAFIEEHFPELLSQEGGS